MLYTYEQLETFQLDNEINELIEELREFCRELIICADEQKSQVFREKDLEDDRKAAPDGLAFLTDMGMTF